MKKLTSVLAIAVLLASCNQFDKSKSGMPYKIKKGGSTAKFKQGDILKFNIEFKTGEKDTVLNSTYEHVPAYMKYDTAQLGKYNFTEILPQMSAGDKAEFQLNIDTLKKQGLIPEYNKVFQKGGVIKGRVEILAAFTSDNAAVEDNKKEFELEKQREIKKLEEYISKKGVKTQKTPGGAFVQVVNAGDVANKADSGKQVTVLYKGYTEDGIEFDSNMGAKGAGKPPFSLVIGAHSVIPGWEEGLKYFGKGGKGTIYIPGMLGYGQQSPGPQIKPYANLIFDVEVTDVTTPPPPPPPAAGAMQDMRGGQQMPQQAPPHK